MLPPDLWTAGMVKIEGRFLGACHSLSGPKTFFKLQDDENSYIVIIDEKRDLIVSVIDEYTDKAIYRDEITKRGHEIIKTLKTAGIGFREDDE